MENTGRFGPSRYERLGRRYERKMTGRYMTGRYAPSRMERFGRFERPYGYSRRGEPEYRHPPRYYGRR